MKKTLQFKLANAGTFQILSRRELKIICRYELFPPDMPEILLITNGWSVTNKPVLSKPELHAMLGNSIKKQEN
jgi:hypothetical protein